MLHEHRSTDNEFLFCENLSREENSISIPNGITDPQLGVPFLAKAPATCGELVQGVLGEKDFLINSPIDLFATAAVTLDESGSVLVTTPGIFSKVEHCAKATLASLGHSHLGAQIKVASQIPRGKGLASSTSELSATIIATAKALGYEISPEEITRILLQVDTSDGVSFPGVIACNHLTGELIASLGNPPPLKFIIVDTGGSVETSGFDREKARFVARMNQPKLEMAVEFVKRGFRSKVPRLVASGATISAFVNQELLPKKELHILLKGTIDEGALGVNCAHTGTVLGVMFDPRITSEEMMLKRVWSLVGEEKVLGVHSLISGGTAENMASRKSRRFIGRESSSLPGPSLEG